jgi:hypothetical protein
VKQGKTGWLGDAGSESLPHSAGGIPAVSLFQQVKQGKSGWGPTTGTTGMIPTLSTARCQRPMKRTPSNQNLAID